MKILSMKTTIFFRSNAFFIGMSDVYRLFKF